MRSVEYRKNRRGRGWPSALRGVSLGVMLVAAGCSGGGPDDAPLLGDPLSASFHPSATEASADGVRLVQARASGEYVTIEVVITGPTASADLYSFVFDLMLADPTVARYVDQSAVFGSALTLDNGQSHSVLVSQVGDRVTVGVSKVGGGAGNGVVSSEPAIVSLVFRVLRAGTTSLSFGSGPGAPAALDSSGATVPSVRFDPLAGTIAAR